MAQSSQANAHTSGGDMTKVEDRDYWSDRELLVDPYSYYKELRDITPVWKDERRDVLIVTGFEECLQVLNDPATFSSINASIGPVTPMPWDPHGKEDIADLIAEHRDKVPTSSAVTSLDGEAHHNGRSLLNRLFVPARLKANEEYMERLAAEMVGALLIQGTCDIIADAATPFVTLVIADLLGVPADDREMFRAKLAVQDTLFFVDAPARTDRAPSSYLELAGTFVGYIEDRRHNPRDDILTQMSLATYPDGSIPPTGTLAGIMMILFGAGQDTSAKLLGSAVRYLCDNPEVQATLRTDPSLIPAFIEEMMRLEGSTKVTSRLATCATKIGNVDVAPGQQIALVLAGANRDPRRWENPDNFELGRRKINEHIGFGRGAHTCIGAPLARKEVAIFLKHLLAKTAQISIAEDVHGARENRVLNYEPSFGMRGLVDLTIELTTSRAEPD
jgi:cytochrome P450